MCSLLLLAEPWAPATVSVVSPGLKVPVVIILFLMYCMSGECAECCSQQGAAVVGPGDTVTALCCDRRL